MKFIGILVLLLVLVVGGVVGYVFFFAGDLVERGMEEFGPQYLGTSVDVGGANIDFVGGQGSIMDVQIGNPAGYDGAYSMRTALISTTIDPNSTGDLVIIKNLAIDGASLAAIARGSKTNLQQLMDNLEQAMGATTETAPAEESGSETLFIVDRFSFTNANVSLDSDVIGSKQLTIPDIILADVGRKSNGATALELAEQLMNPITEAVSRAVVAEGLDLEGVENRLRDKLRDKIPGVEKLKDLF